MRIIVCTFPSSYATYLVQNVMDDLIEKVEEKDSAEKIKVRSPTTMLATQILRQVTRTKN